MHKKFDSHNGFYSVNASQWKHKIKSTTVTKQRKKYSWLIPHFKPELKETTSWTTVGQAKDIASSPNALVKALCRDRHWVWGPTRRRAIKEWSIAINRGWVNN